MTNYDDLKFEQFFENPDLNFSNAKIVNFDIIHHECQGDKLKHPESYYETIRNKDFKSYEDDVRNHAMSCPIKSERDYI